MSRLMTTKEVSQFLNINEKMVYQLISEKGLPATKITGKWLFPGHLVEQWVEGHTVNYPEPRTYSSDHAGLLIITGSNDLLLDRLIAHYNTLYPGVLAVFGNLGSMGGCWRSGRTCATSLPVICSRRTAANTISSMPTRNSTGCPQWSISAGASRGYCSPREIPKKYPVSLILPSRGSGW